MILLTRKFFTSEYLEFGAFDNCSYPRATDDEV